MTTVNERGGPGSGVLTIGRVLVGWADPAHPGAAARGVLPRGPRRRRPRGRERRAPSATASRPRIAAALSLPRPAVLDARRRGVRASTGTPADGKLEPGDEIAHRSTAPRITEPADVTAAMSKVTPGETVAVVVQARGQGAARDRRSSTTTNPRDPSRAFLGITIGEDYKAPFDHRRSRSTASAARAPGMMLSLGIIDKLTPGELNGGKFVAGTGTITPDGKVGPIGGIEQKLRAPGAPAPRCSSRRPTTAPTCSRGGIPDGLTVAKVSTLDEAVERRRGLRRRQARHALLLSSASAAQVRVAARASARRGTSVLADEHLVVDVVRAQAQRAHPRRRRG